MDHGGFGGRGPLTKSEIYKTSHGKGIIEDELLNLLAVKMRIMLRSLTAKSFDSKQTEALKRVWSEVRCTTQLCVSNKGAQKDANNIRSCQDLWSITMDELPPVTFTSLDVSHLLVKLESLQVQWPSGRAPSWVMPLDCHQIGP